MSRKVALTGVAAGIGAATAELLRARGDEVIGVDIKDADVVADLATREGRQAAIDGVLDRCGGELDALLTVAGVSQAGPPQVSVNYFGSVELVQGLRPALAAARGKVGLVGSISGTQPVDDAIVAACLALDEPAALRAAAAVERPNVIYPSTKSALAQWLRSVAPTADYAGAGIPINAIAPGVILTGMSAHLFENPEWKKIMDEAVPMPLNGYAEPEVIGHSLLWLISPENTHMTGQVIYVDGGAEATNRSASHF
ncbi:SDR family oxidoreductase [Nocardioides alcanivorans]|uniref:SDR family oxidoreductase n=1 Tax=Nocardioides alcanivorans TaxID=2897352 RepID=UPI001F1C17F4|nr:SDR family oxidoreductase [Nocardioides alcanivorans]